MLVDLALGFLLYGIVMILYIYYKWFEEGKDGFRGYEGFESNRKVATITPGNNDSKTSLSPAAAMNINSEMIIQNTNIRPLSQEVALQNWSNMTSETCFKKDVGESLKLVGNYLQRTNNYMRSNPDDCSAPNHEFVGTFYDSSAGIGQTPPSGERMPTSTLCQ